MYIKKVKIENFKSFGASFEINFHAGTNILVGNNEAGKSTILEAINLALSGMIDGKYIRNDISPYIFNFDTVTAYLSNINNGDRSLRPPQIFIELYFGGQDLSIFEGDNTKNGITDQGIRFEIIFDTSFEEEYQHLIKEKIESLPVEYYTARWVTFARDETITPRSIPIKSALIDSGSARFHNGSDIYISRILKDSLEKSELVSISQAYRRMKETFSSDESVKKINDKITQNTSISRKRVEVSVDFSFKNAWENNLLTFLENIPFHYIGKGEQCSIKIKLSLSHKKTKEANILLIEEPENHLSYSGLNKLLYDILDDKSNKQKIITTHSSFVANKLNLCNLIILSNKKTITLESLNPKTAAFFSKASGYDTLRMLLCEKTILVEGGSDELIIQKAYMKEYDNKLPIQDGIDVISVGISFLRFLEIADHLDSKVTVVTDNDGDPEQVAKKYKRYLTDTRHNIKICYQKTVNSGPMTNFNYNTLEPCMVNANSQEKIEKILDKTFPTEDKLFAFMKENKTLCALAFFDYSGEFNFPEYIMEAVRHVK